jgi:hypothetical protein
MFDFIKRLFGFGHKTALYQQRVPQWEEFIESVRANSERNKSLVVVAATSSDTTIISSQCEIAIEDITFPDDLNNESNSPTFESNECIHQYNSSVDNGSNNCDSFYGDSTSNVSDI